jgi:diacylglycerol kinase family enzyme
VRESRALPHAVLLNPAANGGKAAARWRAVCAESRGRELGLQEVPCYEGLETREWMETQLKEGRTNFVACGGDGTVNLALNAILGSAALSQSARLGAIGLGSSNDFHKPQQRPERELIAGRPARLSFEQAKAHDIGRAIFPEGERYFAINASVGVTAEANAFFNRAPGGIRLLKRSWVDGAILASALVTFATFKNLELEVGLDRGRARKTFLTNLGVIKNRHFSGSFRYETGPEADDGKLGIHFCEEMGRAEMLKTLASLARGRFTGLSKTTSAEAEVAEVRSVDGKDFAIETDGEVTRAPSARFEILSRRLQLCP